MSRGLPKVVLQHLEKSRAAALAAVEVYNKPGSQFKTAHYLVMMTIAWTALFHAIFFKRGNKPWHRKKNSGSRILYEKVDGEYKHWELRDCLREFFQGDNPPERQNLEFIIGLRNKIEHRHLPQLDPALYGECQSSLMNFESLLVSEFGEEYAINEGLAVALQFSRSIPDEKAAAIRKLVSTSSKDVLDYIEKFRGGLPPEVLNSTQYSFSVYLVPKTANRKSAADLCVEFVPYDASHPEEMEELKKITTMIKEKQVPVASADLLKPCQVLEELRPRIPFKVNSATHVRAWQHFQIRPRGGSTDSAKTDARYCMYDKPHGDYLYTKAWVKKLTDELSDPSRFRAITGQEPEPVDSA